MKRMAYLLGIDVGTSGTKTALFSEDGTLAASFTGDYPLYQPENGYAEQQPEDWWNAVVKGIRFVLQKSDVSKNDIAGIGLTGQMHGLVMLGKNGEVLRRAILWCDQRTSTECGEITCAVGAKRLIEITANPALTGFTASKLLWVRKHEPEIYAKCSKILLPKDYIRFRLTGEYATDVSDASGMQFLDVPNRCWSDEVLSKLSIDKDMIARVYESPDITGRVSKEASRLTRLKEGTPVVAGAGDNAAAAVGTGVVEDGRAFTTIGTSGVVFAHTSRLTIDPKGRVHTFCCAVPGAWHVMGVTQAAGLSLKWFCNNFCQDEIETARLMGTNVYSLLDREAERSPIGSNRLLYLPYLMGERTPHLDPEARGVFFGLSSLHTKGDMLRAVFEGVAYSLRDCAQVLRGMGVSLLDMAACGGGGTSFVWRQMLADLFDCTVKTVVPKDGAALGAALLAAVGVNVYGSLQEACGAVIQTGVEQQPVAENTAAYEKYYALYTQLYPALKDSFKLLDKLDG